MRKIKENWGKITVAMLVLMLVVGSIVLYSVLPSRSAQAADISKSQGNLFPWTILDDIGATPYLETAEHTYTDTISSTLYVTMVNVVGTATVPVGFKVYVRSGDDDDGWREIASFEADRVAAETIDVDAQAAADQAVIPLSATALFDQPEDIGLTYFLRDATIANSELVIWGGVHEDAVSITVIDDLVRTHENTADLYRVVKQWPIRLPNGNGKAKIVFYNQDDDANYACCVDYANEDDVL